MNLHEIPVRSLRNTAAQIEGLAALCAAVPNRNRMVEVGSFAGESMQVFGLYFQEVYCVDPWRWSEAAPRDCEAAECLFDARARACMGAGGKIVKVRGESHIAAARWVWPLDLVYIDGEHDRESVKRDIEAWRRHVRPGGWIGGHDYLNNGTPGVRAAFNELLGEPFKVFADWSCLYRA